MYTLTDSRGVNKNGIIRSDLYSVEFIIFRRFCNSISSRRKGVIDMYVFNIPTEYKEYQELNEQELDDYTRELINRRLETLTAYLKCKEYIK